MPRFAMFKRYQHLSDLRKKVKKYREELGFSQKEFAEEMRRLSFVNGKLYKINESNLSKTLNGDPKRNFGHPDEPDGLLWMTVTLMIGNKTHSVLPTLKELNDWLYEVCPDDLISDKGRAWIIVEAPLVLERMDIPWNILGDTIKLGTTINIPPLPKEIQALHEILPNHNEEVSRWQKEKHQILLKLLLEVSTGRTAAQDTEPNIQINVALLEVEELIN